MNQRRRISRLNYACSIGSTAVDSGGERGGRGGRFQPSEPPRYFSDAVLFVFVRPQSRRISSFIIRDISLRQIPISVAIVEIVCRYCDWLKDGLHKSRMVGHEKIVFASKWLFVSKTEP